MDATKIKGRRTFDYPAWSWQRRWSLLFYIGRGHIDRDHESVGSFELERLRSRLIGLNIVWHHYETFLPGRAPVFQVVHHNVLVSVSLEAVQLYFRGLAAVDGCVRFVLVEFPGVNVPHRSLQRVPLYSEHMRDE